MKHYEIVSGAKFRMQVVGTEQVVVVNQVSVSVQSDGKDEYGQEANVTYTLYADGRGLEPRHATLQNFTRNLAALKAEQDDWIDLLR